MNTQPKPARKKSSVRPCPQGCGFALHDKDQHEACPVCMGIVHARRALTEPGACGFCQPLRHSTLERRVTFVERVLGQATVARQDPLLSESRDPASSASDSDEPLAHVPTGDWAEHMEFVDGLAELEPEPPESAGQLPLQLAAPQDEEDVLDICLDVHGLSEDEQDALASGQYATDTTPVGDGDTSFFSLYRRAAEELEVDWPAAAPAQKQSRFAGFYLPQEPTATKNGFCVGANVGLEQATFYPRHSGGVWAILGPGRC